MTDRHRGYTSPLAERYASKAMLELWSPQVRHGLWRQLWLALAEAERELGVDIPEAAIAQMRAAPSSTVRRSASRRSSASSRAT